MKLEFEWDENKANLNRKKHGVAFADAAWVFADPMSVTVPDVIHSTDEDRFVILGESRNRKLLVVSFVERDDRIRIISARKATRRERKGL